jgi:hypothetical protein
MADSNAADDVDTVDDQQKNLSKEQAAESKQLDAVTDFVEEQEGEISKDAQKVLNDLTASGETEEQARVSKELAAVQVKQEDIDLYAAEFEVSQDEAENKIRQAKGDVKLAIRNAIAQ